MRTSMLACLTATVLPFASFAASAENLDVLMSKVFPPGEATYIGFESIERQDIPLNTSIDRKYLVVDFRFPGVQPGIDTLQASVHKVCMTLLKDRELIRSLSDSGYDMVAVAFDRKTQFDCL